MSYISGGETDRILKDITKTSHRDIDDELKRKHVEIEDEFRREQTKLQDEFMRQKNNIRQLLHEQFEQAIYRLKESIKKGDYEDEILHRMTTDWLNSELKTRVLIINFLLTQVLFHN
jgi:F0F1-type ATP synthase membrane subunit b/b'